METFVLSCVDIEIADLGTIDRSCLVISNQAFQSTRCASDASKRETCIDFPIVSLAAHVLNSAYSTT